LSALSVVLTVSLFTHLLATVCKGVGAFAVPLVVFPFTHILGAVSKGVGAYTIMPTTTHIRRTIRQRICGAHKQTGK